MKDWPEQANHLLLYWRSLGYSFEFIRDLMRRELNIKPLPGTLLRTHRHLVMMGAIIDKNLIKEYLPDASSSEGGRKPANDSEGFPAVGVGGSTHSSTQELLRHPNIKE